jgi:hypothetical protein
MKSKRHFPSIIGTVLILSLALSSCSTSKKSAVACPEFPDTRNSKVASGLKKNRTKTYTTTSVVNNGKRHAGSTGKNHWGKNLTVNNASETKAVRMGGTESASYPSKIEYSGSLTASLDNSIIPDGRISSADYLMNSQIYTDKSDNFYISQTAGCDTLVLRSGSVILGKVEEIGQSEIKYRRCDNLTGPVIVMAKSDVVQIKFVNGTREVIPSDNPGIMPVYTSRAPQENFPPKMEGLGLTGFIASLVGLFIAGIPLGLLGVVFGGISLSKIKRYPARYRGRGIAIASIIIGFVAFVGAIVVLSML